MILVCLMSIRWLIFAFYFRNENGEEDLGVDVVWLVCDVVASHFRTLCAGIPFPYNLYGESKASARNACFDADDAKQRTNQKA